MGWGGWECGGPGARAGRKGLRRRARVRVRPPSPHTQPATGQPRLTREEPARAVAAAVRDPSGCCGLQPRPGLGSRRPRGSCSGGASCPEAQRGSRGWGGGCLTGAARGERAAAASVSRRPRSGFACQSKRLRVASVTPRRAAWPTLGNSRGRAPRLRVLPLRGLPGVEPRPNSPGAWENLRGQREA